MATSPDDRAQNTRNNASSPGAAHRPTRVLAPGLYVVATPIGNLGDVSKRLIETLATVDVIFCEDTRRTGQLCAGLGIKTERRAYHEHNASGVRPQIIEMITNGAAVALVSDAGTPLVSDPGYKLVDEIRHAGGAVFAIPGPCAAIAAISIAGLPCDRFFFAGFPPTKTGARATYLAEIKAIPSSLVFYESPNRLGASLAAMGQAFGERDAAVVRELTKIHEEVVRGPLGELAERYLDAPAKGEIVIVVAPPDADTPSADETEITAFLQTALTEMSVKDAAAAAADAFSIPRKTAYALAIAARQNS